MKQLHRAQVAFLLRLGLAVILCIGIGGESVSFCAADQDTIQALEARQGAEAPEIILSEKVRWVGPIQGRGSEQKGASGTKSQCAGRGNSAFSAND